jgi:erythromycin esterase
MKRLTLFLGLLLAVACGDDTETSATTGPGGAGGDGGGGGGMVDPLDLASCPGDPVAWDDPADLPAVSWSGDDEHAAICALRGIEPAVAAKHILCSGENNHGVSESSRWHAILARFLIHRLGVRTIVLESPAAAVAPWDRYLTNGDPADLALGFTDAVGSLADVVEEEHLVDALRAVQAELDPEDRIRLTGFDVAVQPHLTRLELLDFLGVVAPGEVAMWDAALPELGAGVDWAAAGQAAADLHAEIEANESAWVAATDEASWRGARRNAANLRDGYLFLDYYFAGNFITGDATFREPGMIRNAEEIQAESSTPVLFIAHDLHCARDYIMGQTEQGADSPAMGTSLAQAHGADYFVLGQLYFSGSFLNRTQSGFQAQQLVVGANTLEAAIAPLTMAPAIAVGGATSFLDLAQPWPMWNQSTMVPRDEYDGILWIREVTPTTLRN